LAVVCNNESFDGCCTVSFDTGDYVQHIPSGERWIVAYVRDGRLAWLGWPQGEAAAADCELIRKCSPEKRQKWLLDMAAMGDDSDPRCRYAKHRLTDMTSGGAT
jgi:hypothetical protein